MTDDTGRDVVISEATILETCGDRVLPEMGVVEQLWETDPIPPEEIEDRAAACVTSFEWDDVPDGGSVAIGVGSRGIANLPTIVRGVVRGVEDAGYEPFVFPAMGSHGGATGDGQRKKLEALGVTPESIGCEIRSEMAVEQVGTTADREVPIVADANAVAADAIVPINRIKPHTGFSGCVESGLSKMLVIGMGKQRGAKLAHEWAVDWSFRKMIPSITERLLSELPIVGGVAIVEDQYDDTVIVEGIPSSEFLDREAELLEIAYDYMPTLPFDELDVLVVDRMGKEISGTGMDTNVIGRIHIAYEPPPERPTIGRIYVRSLTGPSHGNATAVGLADFVHADLEAATDRTKTCINALTASAPQGSRMPPVVETDRGGLVAALSTIGVYDPGTVRVVRVTDTMHLDRFYASAALVEAARKRDDLRVLSEPSPIEFENERFRAPSPSTG
ncbi:Uncharacterized protein AArcCO_1661 [Halalkaliarchaeum sp. AArc-CO]|uniref:DUF362 domain-containing protein n=1 Tax=Halalkaliarchaeum sp. AArc-CO TaxID=2866381 RepID=UPI00217EE5B9|nr:DUF362 domain-containing protein [Halalkaliarchaeum sp. AArc-CO]UWG50962.1 Uncharacterized protein AArcCO_1661 [Halalkaliarchaeum sp. AArc-CO]